MNVYQKLNLAREKFHQSEIKKSGHNKFANYYYFELADFILPALKIFREVGLASVIRFEEKEATMEIVNVDKPEDKIYIMSPMSEASLKGCHPVQNLGAVETYIRRYLWVTALEIVEHDALDATTGETEPPKKVETKAALVDGGKTADGTSIKIDPSHTLFVDSMIEWGGSATSMSELTNLWKENQKMVDEVKGASKEQFKRLQDAFTGFKSNFKEEA